MYNSKLKGTLFGFLFFGLGLSIAYLFKVKSPILDTIIATIGAIIFIVICYILFKSKGILKYMIFGASFALFGYSIVFVLWPTYPQFSFIVFPIILLLSLVFFNIGIFKIIKNFINDLKNDRLG